MIYIEIHRLYKEGFSKSAISRKLNISRNRVIDYLNKSPEDFEEFLSSLRTREKKLDWYQREILDWLREYPDLTGAQVYDWLEEKLGVKNVSENTVRNYLNEMRDFYHIPKTNVSRTYSSVPELPMGQQAQVDFGQTVVRINKEITNGSTLSLSCFLIRDINMLSGLIVHFEPPMSFVCTRMLSTILGE